MTMSQHVHGLQHSVAVARSHGLCVQKQRFQSDLVVFERCTTYSEQLRRDNESQVVGNRYASASGSHGSV